jgi:sterol desaturase/sphingolipid hydroxylase (fatty acid hydroxylase superfamily)
MTSGAAHWPMLEAYVSGVAFAVWIMGYRILDQIPMFNKYRFEKDIRKPVPLFLPDPNNSWVPLLAYILGIHFFHYIFPKPPLCEAAPTFVRVVIEVLLGLVLYDFFFFWLHLGMHSFPSLSHLHKHHIHHNQTMLTASEVQHHSLVDGTLQVAVNIMVQNIIIPQFGKKHLISKLLHNIVITYMLTEIHAGYDGWWSLHNIFPFFYGGAQRHEEHHKGGHVAFAQFFLYLDFFLESYKSMKSMSQRKYFDISLLLGLSGSFFRFTAAVMVLLTVAMCSVSAAICC